MTFRTTRRFAAAAALSIALAACGSADDASTEAEADTVEIPANEALTGVTAEPVADPDANAVVADTENAEEAAAAEAEMIEETGDSAAETAGAALDAMESDAAVETETE